MWLFTGGQFLWPGVRLGHVTQVPIPRIVGQDEHAEEKVRGWVRMSMQGRR